MRQATEIEGYCHFMNDCDTDYFYSVYDNQYAEVIFNLFNLFFNNNKYMITLLIIIMITIVICHYIYAKLFGDLVAN